MKFESNWGGVGVKSAFQLAGGEFESFEKFFVLLNSLLLIFHVIFHDFFMELVATLLFMNNAMSVADQIFWHEF